jgi:hypothetical protein
LIFGVDLWRLRGDDHAVAGHFLVKEQFRSSTVHLPKAMFNVRQVSAGVGPEGFVFQEI